MDSECGEPVDKNQRGFQKKRIVICCDGTGKNAEAPLMKLTNVSRIARCIKNTHSDGSPQIVHYQSGVGTGLWRANNLYEGATGKGISRPLGRILFKVIRKET